MDGLVFLEVVVLDSLPVLGDAVYGDDAFVLGEELAVEGRSGRIMRDTMPHAMEMEPKMMNMYCHFCSPVVICPTA